MVENYCRRNNAPIFYIPNGDTSYRYNNNCKNNPYEKVRIIGTDPCKQLCCLPNPGCIPRGRRCPIVIKPRCCPPKRKKCKPCEPIYKY